ncbi:MAG: YdcF family protein [Curvibacter sp.]|nr:MAG: YdcF family protein [Curvibacter sp.]
MLLFFKKLLTSLLMPPFSLVLLAALGLWLQRQRPRLGPWVTWLALLVLSALSWPPVADALVDSLERYPALSAQGLSQAQAIVVLGGGIYPNAPEYGGEDGVSRATLQRLQYAAVLYRRSSLPVLVTGGAPEGGRPEAAVMQKVLEQQFGVPVRWVESASLDTLGNAALSAQMLHAAGVQRVALVSQAWHLPRAAALFESQGLTVLPAPTGFRTRLAQAPVWYLPSAEALLASQTALREWLGRAMQP